MFKKPNHVGTLALLPLRYTQETKCRILYERGFVTYAIYRLYIASEISDTSSYYIAYA